MTFLNRLKQTAGQLADSASRQAEVLRVQHQLGEVATEIERNHAEIGKRALHLLKRRQLHDAEIDVLAKRVDELEEQMQDLRQRVQDLQQPPTRGPEDAGPQAAPTPQTPPAQAPPAAAEATPSAEPPAAGAMCPHCGGKVPEQARFCEHCGEKLADG